MNDDFVKIMNKECWKNMSFCEQMGNVAGEISRARHWDNYGDIPTRNLSLERVLELIDLIIKCNQKAVRVRELARFREVVGQWLVDGHDLDVPPEDIENYCLPFAIRARGDR